MRYRQKAYGGGKNFNNPIIIIVTIILVIGLVGMIFYDHIESEKKAEELQELVQTKREKEKTREKEIQKLEQAEMEKKEKEEKDLKNRYQIVKNALNKYLPGIVCWGDSLTAGAGGEGTTYPNILALLIKENVTDKLDLSKISSSLTGMTTIDAVTVINMGVGGEKVPTICGRDGCIPFVVSKRFTIPADTSKVEIKFESASGRSVAPLRQGDAGMEYVVINGIKGVINIEQEDYTSMDYKYWFTREKAGGEVSIKKNTEIVTAASETNLNYIPVIFIGQNGGYDSIDELIEQQRAIIKHQNGNPKGRFIIVGMHTGTEKERATLEKRMYDEYKDQYINLRKYMSTDGLEDAGIEATKKDLEMMRQGMTPESLLCDNVHFNAVGYDLIGKLIYQQMDKLGYFYEVQNAIEDAMEVIK